jgi:hypothetical protein
MSTALKLQDKNGTMKKRQEWKRKIIPAVMLLALVVSLGGILTNAWFYQASYKKVYFETVETIITYEEPAQIDSPEPVVNIALNDDGTKNVSITCFETISISDGGFTKRENQVTIMGMKISAEIYRWSFINLDSFEDMTKGEMKLKRILEWTEFQAGISQLLSHLQKCRQFLI